MNFSNQEPGSVACLFDYPGTSHQEGSRQVVQDLRVHKVVNDLSVVSANIQK